MEYENGESSACASSRRVFGVRVVTLLLVVLALHMSAYCGVSDAAPNLTVGIRSLVPVSDVGGGFKPAVSASARPPPPPPPPLPFAATYRPPVINFKYMGGPILWKPIHLYIVWYGTWTEPAKNVIRTASNSLTPKSPISQFPNLSGLWNVVRKYYQEAQSPGEGRKYASSDVSICGEVDDAYSHGHSINGDVDPLGIIVSHLGKDLRTDLEQGVYFLFTSSDVAFGSDLFCGFHSYGCVNLTDCDPSADDGKKIIYSFIPIPSAVNGILDSSCNPFATPANPNFGIQARPPNYDVSPDGALDALIVTYMHELMELTLDPKVNVNFAWIMNLVENSETADFCSTDYVAGDWFYCDTPSFHPGFPPNASCTSYFTNHAALTDPKSQTAFNLYGIGGSRFLSQMIWSLDTKGCATQPEAACSKQTVVLSSAKGSVQRGLFFRGVSIQTYAPGQKCSWKIQVSGAKCIHINFETVALGYDDLDYVTVSDLGNAVKKTVTGFGSNIKVTVTGNVAKIRFVTYGRKSPYPKSAGFIMHYEAGLYC